jgi:hypothetical protein
LPAQLLMASLNLIHVHAQKGIAEWNARIACRGHLFINARGHYFLPV